MTATDFPLFFMNPLLRTANSAPFSYPLLNLMSASIFFQLRDMDPEARHGPILGVCLVLMIGNVGISRKLW